MAPKRPVGAKSSKRETSATRELADIEVLSQRCIDEAPEPGSNILDTDAAQISVGEERAAYGRARKFTELPISQRTLAGLAKGKWQRMTDIQRAAIPHALAGRDVLGAAKTGSGKTLAFLVPVIELLYRERWSRLDGLGALVISPTRELALQIFDVLRVLGHKHDLSAGLVIGGKDKAEEAERITRMSLLVCTPGRLLQHFDETPGFDASNLRVLVLDEADRILDMGFHTALTAIVQGLPKKRQTLLFSATQTKDVKALARLSLRHPQYIGVHEKASVSTPSRLEQHYMRVKAEEKLDVLFGFVRSHLQAKTLVFLSSCKQVQFVHAAFSAMRPGVPLLCLHGRQKQMKRLAIYTEFCNKSHCVLFATDVAARGLDFPSVSWVVQADCPEDVPTYIHRTGRTARHTSSGRALLLLLPSEEKMLGLLEAAKVPMRKLTPNAKHIHSLRQKLQSLLAERSELKYTAQRAFVSYVRSVALQGEKAVFDAKALPLQALAESMGLLAPPRVRFLSATQAKKAKKKQPRNKLKRLLLRNTAERRGELTGAAARTLSEKTPSLRPDATATETGDGDGASGPLLKVRRTLQPDAELSDDEGEQDDAATAAAAARKAKIKIRKGGTVAGGKRTVFDEAGRPLEEKLGGTFASIVAEKAQRESGTAALDQEARVAALRESLREASAADRERERERVREKHREQKRKRKAAEAEAAGRGDAGAKAVLGAAEEGEGISDEEEGGASAPHHAPPKGKRPRHDEMTMSSLADDEQAAERKLAALLG